MHVHFQIYSRIRKIIHIILALNIESHIQGCRIGPWKTPWQKISCYCAINQGPTYNVVHRITWWKKFGKSHAHVSLILLFSKCWLVTNHGHGHVAILLNLRDSCWQRYPYFGASLRKSLLFRHTSRRQLIDHSILAYDRLATSCSINNVRRL